MDLHQSLLCPLLKIFNSEIMIFVLAKEICLLQMSYHMKKGIHLVVNNSVQEDCNFCEQDSILTPSDNKR